MDFFRLPDGRRKNAICYVFGDKLIFENDRDFDGVRQLISSKRLPYKSSISSPLPELRRPHGYSFLTGKVIDAPFQPITITIADSGKTRSSLLRVRDYFTFYQNMITRRLGVYPGHERFKSNDVRNMVSRFGCIRLVST